MAAPSPADAASRPKLEELKRRLADWLRPRLGARIVDIGQIGPPSGASGSNEALLVQARWRDRGSIQSVEFLLRLQPPPELQLFMDSDLRIQHELLRALHRYEGVRVADSYWYEDDPGVLGRPFLIMQRLPGRARPTIASPDKADWLAAAGTAERSQLWYSAVEHLARIHRLPAELTGMLERPADGHTGIEQQLNYWRRAAVWASQSAAPEVLELIAEWLYQNRPNQFQNTLSWGDARIGNMMFDDDFQVVGVLHWEMASLAGPMADLAWWVFTHEHQACMGQPRLDGIGGRQATIELWEALSGQVAHDLHWHEVFAGYRLCVLGLRHTQIANRDHAATRARMRNSFVARTCELLELAVPAEFR